MQDSRSSLAHAGILEAARGLETNPLFVLSTAGQELFHTNMLFWLARAYPVEAGPVFKVLGLERLIDPASPTVGGPSVWRERGSIDLVVDVGFEQPKLLLENKVLSSPGNEQLRRYVPKAKAFFGSGKNVRFTLLTLIPGTEDTQPPWQRVEYGDLLEALGETAASLRSRDTFHADLTDQYRALVQGLVRLREASLPEDLEHPWSLSSGTREQLREMRVLPLVEKLRANYLANLVGKATGTEIDSFLTRTLGAIQWYEDAPISGTQHHKGVQLQGDQFRLVIITGGDVNLTGKTSAKREKRHNHVRDHYGDYFRFPPPGYKGPTDVLASDRSRKDWLGYDPDFVYQYRPIAPDATWSQVVGLFIGGIEHARMWQPRSNPA